MEFQHPHPVQIIRNTSRFWLLLLLPVLRGFLFSGGNLYVWMKGAWMDLLVLVAIVLFGYLSWYFNTFYVGKDGVYIHKGIFLIQQYVIPYEMISSITVENPFYLSPIRGSYVKLDTDAGNVRQADLSFVMKRKDVERLVKYAQEKLVGDAKNMGRIYSPRLWYIAILSLVSSNSLTGVLFASTLISQSGNLLGKEFEDMLVTNLTKIAELLAFGIPPAAAILAYLLLGGWGLAFLLNIIRNKDFSVNRRNQSMTIRAGILIPRYYCFNIGRINLVEIRQTLFTKVLGYYSVYINCAGYGKLKNGTSVLIPAAERREAMRNLNLLFPEIQFVKRDIKPRPVDFRRFIFIPTIIIVVFAVIIAGSYLFFPGFRGLILFVGIMIEIIPMLYLIVRMISYSHTGIGYSQEMLTASYTKRLLFCRVSIPKEKVSKIVYRQNLLQKSTGCCDVIIYTYSEGTKRHIIRNLNQTEVQELLKHSI